MQGIKQHPKLYGLLLSICSTLIVALCVMSYYTYVVNSMDDMGMRNIISGLYTGNPDAHVYFMNYALSQILARLYQCIPTFSWYDMFLLTANYVCLALLLYRVTEKFAHCKGKAICISIVLFLVGWITNLVLIEWTATAGIMSATAIFWYGTIPDENSGVGNFIEYLIPLCLLFFAYNLRHSVVDAMMPVAFVVFLVKVLLEKKGKRKEIGIELCFLVICFACVIGSYTFNQHQYRGEAWEKALELSDYRSVMFDYYGYPDYETYQSLYQECGLTKAEYQCLKEDYDFTFVYTGKDDVRPLGQISDKAKEIYYSEISLLQRILQGVRQRWVAFWSQTYANFNILYTLLILLIVYLSVIEKKWIYIVIAGIFELEFDAMWCYLYVTGRLPERVGYVLCIGQIMSALFLLWKFQKIEKTVIWKSLAIAGTFIITISLGVSLSNVKMLNEAVLSAGKIRTETKLYCEEHKENLYFRDFNSFRYADTTKGKEERIASNMRPFNDWTTNFPLKTDLAPLDGSQELCDWIRKQSNVYLLVDKNRAEGVCNRKEALFEARGIACELELSDELVMPNGYVIQVYHFHCDEG